MRHSIYLFFIFLIALGSSISWSEENKAGSVSKDLKSSAQDKSSYVDPSSPSAADKKSVIPRDTSLKLKFLGSQEFETAQKVAGISGLVWDAQGEMLLGICDDRGNYGKPRFYEFPITWKDRKPTITDAKAVNIHVGPKSLEKLPKVLDLEAIQFLPWGNLLISSEGDLNRKPRLAPSLIEVKRDGTFIREYELPKETRPEGTGLQKKGIRNNRGFEALAQNSLSSTSAEQWVVISEEPLMSEKLNVAYLYEMKNAWSIESRKTFSYEMAHNKEDYLRGVSEALWVKDGKLLVLERYVILDINRSLSPLLGFDLFSCTVTDLTAKTKSTEVLPLCKDRQLVISSESSAADLGTPKSFQNYEGLAYIPSSSGHSDILVLVSDNNFLTSAKTTFLFYELEK